MSAEDKSSQDIDGKLPSATLDDNASRILGGERTPLPEELIGAVITDSNGKKSKLISIIGIGENHVVYEAQKEDNTVHVLKVFKSFFDPITRYKDQLNEIMPEYQERPDDIIRICDSILEIDPYNEVAAFDKSLALSVKKKCDDAMYFIDLAIKANPNDVVNRVQKSVYLAEWGKHEEAIINLLDVIKIDEKGVLSFLNQMARQDNLWMSAEKLLDDQEFKEKAQSVIDFLSKASSDAFTSIIHPAPIEIESDRKISWSPFFTPDKKLRLGEEFIASGMTSGYRTGEIIAKMHLVDFYDFDSHLENIVVDHWGDPIFFDTMPYIAEPTDTKPFLAALSLEPVFLTSLPEFFHAVLSGYFTTYISQTDNPANEFIQELMMFIGGDFETIPSIRTRSLKVAEYSDFLGLSWSFDAKKQLSFTINKPEKLVTLWENEPTTVICIATFMIFSGINPNRLIIPHYKKLRNNSNILHQILKWYDNRSLITRELKANKTADIDGPAMIATTILRELAKKYRYPSPPKTSTSSQPLFQQPDFHAYSLYLGYLKRNDSDESRVFFDGLIDFNNFILDLLIKHKALQPPDNNIIANFVYGSFLAIQQSPFGPDWDSKQILRIENDSNLAIERIHSANDESDEWIFKKISLVHTLGNAYIKLFNRSIRKNIFRWSYIRKCLDHRIASIRLISTYIKNKEMLNVDQDENENIKQIFNISINSLNSALLIYLNAVSQSDDYFHSHLWDKDDAVFPKLLRWGNDILAALENNTVFSSTVLTLLEKFNTLIQVEVKNE